MNKKDIYEHLANIYLDNYRKKKKKSKKSFPLKNSFLLALPIFFLLLLLIFNFNPLAKKTNLNSQIALVIQPTYIKLNYNFTAAKKEIYSFDLKSMNMSNFKALGFSARKLHPKEAVFLRIELINSLKEKSEVYIKDLKYNWQDFKINFSEFKNISDWTNMAQLLFIVEEWNVREKRGIVYIDDIKIIK